MATQVFATVLAQPRVGRGAHGLPQRMDWTTAQKKLKTQLELVVYHTPF